MFKCPHCEKPEIKPLRKAILSPGLLAKCGICSGESTITYKAWLTAMIPGSILMLATLVMDTGEWETTLNVVGFALMVLLPFLFAPLIKFKD
ncbi:MAG: hypothetical protein OEW89_00315 [Gammaproteobacteria bacterium]|nr:hypothetical protein [Gammaproteobacteria bacterium]MDH5594401.1 hypothetical protein [Gammaproteobacteria bacterium]MDH5614228.1 hypothetical protein [Gammaproteobacteria bacterium]